MPTVSIHANIQTEIISLLNSAQKSIYAAVAWFTDSDIFEVLCKKAGNGCLVEIIIHDDLNDPNSINFSRKALDFSVLHFAGGSIMLLNGNHNKYCIVDEKKCLSGSYNWTKYASLKEDGFESVEINTDEDFAKDKLEAFNKLKALAVPFIKVVKDIKVPKFDIHNSLVTGIVERSKGILKITLKEITTRKELPVYASKHIFNSIAEKKDKKNPSTLFIETTDGAWMVKSTIRLVLHQGNLWLDYKV